MELIQESKSKNNQKSKSKHKTTPNLKIEQKNSMTYDMSFLGKKRKNETNIEDFKITNRSKINDKNLISSNNNYNYSTSKDSNSNKDQIIKIKEQKLSYDEKSEKETESSSKSSKKTNFNSIPKNIGNYSYYEENLIGKGSFGTVYFGINKINNMKVAIKIQHLIR